MPVGIGSSVRVEGGMRSIGAVVAVAAGLGALVGCDTVKERIGEPELPSASLNRVDLLDAPSVDQLLGYGCGEVGLGAACGLAGLDVPRKQELRFQFDLVFDVDNPSAVPIPLVETLLGFTAFDTANLGSVCVTYCDPGDEDCEAGLNLPGACDPGSAQDVKGPEDLIPATNLEELVTLAGALEDGIDPADWRVIGAGEVVETHVQFDLGIDPMLGLCSELLDQSVQEFLNGDAVSMAVPYTVEGTLFFDVPDVQRYAIGFGPLADTWDLDAGGR